MRDDDAFRLFSPEEAVGLCCLFLGVIAAAFVVDEHPKSHPKAAVLEQRCEVTVAQYGPGERWRPNPPLPQCAGGVSALPTHILTIPIQEKK